MFPGQHRYFRLDLTPEAIRPGSTKTRKDLHHWSPRRVFAEDDLYTTRWGDITNVEIEKFFFGKLDPKARHAVEFFATFDHTRIDSEAFKTLMTYMSVQKLRTPKGLGNLSEQLKNLNQNMTLLALQSVQNMYCAVWTEAVWQIADASSSNTKFIISDHPVTVYNRACPPLSKWCRGNGDPDIRMSASHTYFPLSLNKVLILTNLSWVRNPYQNEQRIRPNPGLFRDTIFNFQSIQIGRMLAEDEVLLINLVTKKRAKRYIAAAENEWLYPERCVSIDYWKKLGDGYLFMPEPRLVHMGGEVVVGYKGGGSDSWSEYGHKPWQMGFKDTARERQESKALYRFQAEWALRRGARHTAFNSDFARTERHTDSNEMMEHYRSLLQKESRH